MKENKDTTTCDDLASMPYDTLVGNIETWDKLIRYWKKQKTRSAKQAIKIGENLINAWQKEIDRRTSERTKKQESGTTRK